MDKNNEPVLELAGTLLLTEFRLEALENLLFQKEIINKKEFGEEVIKISQRAQTQEIKDKIKEYINMYY